MSAITVFLPFRTARRVLGHLERALWPTAPVDTTEARAVAGNLPSSVHADHDSTTTRELLVPARTDEPAAARASRQAQDYLERRRHKLSQQLGDR